MPSCYVCGRSSNAFSKASGITFHRFPVKESTRVKWNKFLLVNALNPKDVIKTSLVCSLHFHKYCFVLHNTKRKLLLKHAVPSITVSRIKYAKQKYPETLTTLAQDVETDSVTNSISSTSSANSTLSFNRKLVKISRSDLEVENLSRLNKPSTSNTSCTTSSVIPMTNKKKMKTSFIAGSEVSKDISHQMCIKYGINRRSNEIKLHSEKLRSLQQVSKRQTKEIVNLIKLIERKKKQKLVIQANGVQNLNTENCVPLKDISSTGSVDVLNKNSHGCISDEVNQDANLTNVNAFIMDHDYIGRQND